MSLAILLTILLALAKILGLLAVSWLTVFLPVIIVVVVGIIWTLTLLGMALFAGWAVTFR